MSQRRSTKVHEAGKRSGKPSVLLAMLNFVDNFAFEG